MTIGEHRDPSKLSDDELLRGLQQIVGSERRAVAQVLAHLAEVEARKLHLRIGCSSLYDYCLRHLALSEGEAFRRMTGARVARRFPRILRMIENGDLHLSALCALRDCLTAQNHEQLLSEASGKTKRQVEELVVRLRPKPDVSSTLRRLPAPTRVAHETLGAPAAFVDGEAPRQAPPAASPLQRPSPPLVVEPLREDRYRVQLSTSSELKHKLERARDLLSHANPSGDLAVVVERALDVLIDKLERERFALTGRSREVKQDPERRRISNATRREVVARDGLQCSYASPSGERCSSRRFLQFHHEHAWGHGGTSEPANIRVLCAAHNRLLAEEDFGAERVEKAVAASRARRR
jgi:hypothetical protein